LAASPIQLIMEYAYYVTLKSYTQLTNCAA